jgi:DNA-binding transcriptional regulator YhcF (GntR family)
MARQRSPRVAAVKSRLLRRIQDGLHHPGDRFMSNRAVARTFGLSLQTAQRLVDELCSEGVLTQRPSSGTYIAGVRESFAGVQLFVSQRTKELDGVIARLFRYLTQQLDRERIPWTTEWIGRPAALKKGWFPVFCDCPALATMAGDRNYGLLLDDAPPPGLEGHYLHSLAADDYAGGVSAAQLLLRAGAESAVGEYVILAGPEGEAKTAARVAGFRSVIPGSPVVYAGSWFGQAGYAQGKEICRSPLRGVFCCNDLLASGLIRFFSEREFPCPPIIGFDNDPIAEDLELATLEIPEQKMVEEAIQVIRQRLRGDKTAGTRQLFICRPIIRRSIQGLKSWDLASDKALRSRDSVN